MNLKLPDRTHLTSLQKKEEEIRNELSKIKSKIRKESLRLIKERYHLEAGMIIISRGYEYKIITVDPWYTETLSPAFHGVRRKKDGGWSKRQQYIWDWEVKNG